MDEILNFLNENYLYVTGIGLVLVFILIGFLASKKGSQGKNKEGEMVNIDDVETGEINQVASEIEQTQVDFNEQLVSGQNQRLVNENKAPTDYNLDDIKPMPQVDVGGGVVPNLGGEEPKPLVAETIGELPSNDALLVEEEPITPVGGGFNPAPAPNISAEPVDVNQVPNDLGTPIKEEISNKNFEEVVDYVGYVPDKSDQVSNIDTSNEDPAEVTTNVDENVTPAVNDEIL